MFKFVPLLVMRGMVMVYTYRLVGSRIIVASGL